MNIFIFNKSLRCIDNTTLIHQIKETGNVIPIFIFTEQVNKNPDNKEAYDLIKSQALLENSYAGILGRAIEPTIAPLGYDWKIGIALVTSFAQVHLLIYFLNKQIILLLY